MKTGRNEQQLRAWREARYAASLQALAPAVAKPAAVTVTGPVTQTVTKLVTADVVTEGVTPGGVCPVCGHRVALGSAAKQAAYRARRKASKS